VYFDTLCTVYNIHDIKKNTQRWVYFLCCPEDIWVTSDERRGFIQLCDFSSQYVCHCPSQTLLHASNRAVNACLMTRWTSILNERTSSMLVCEGLWSRLRDLPSLRQDKSRDLITVTAYQEAHLCYNSERL
jgi:hypothetical protein